MKQKKENPINSSPAKVNWKLQIGQIKADFASLSENKPTITKKKKI